MYCLRGDDCVAAAGCAEGTGQALTPTLPTVDTNASNADGTKLKASAPQPMSPRSAIRVTNLTPQLVLRNGAGTFDPSVSLSYVFEMFEGDDRRCSSKSDPIPAGGPQTTLTVPAERAEAEQDLRLARLRGASADVPAVALGRACRSERRCRRRPAEAVRMRPGPIPCAGNSGPRHHRCVAARVPGTARQDRQRLSRAPLGTIWSSSATASSRPASARA